MLSYFGENSRPLFSIIEVDTLEDLLFGPNFNVIYVCNTYVEFNHCLTIEATTSEPL